LNASPRKTAVKSIGFVNNPVAPFSTACAA
jgi:hypothetical protein